MTQRITVRDVARAANVSPSTVSRALASSDLVAEETRQHIKQVAQRLGYGARHADEDAQPGALLAIVVPNIEHPSYSSIIKGASQQAQREDFTLTVADSDGDPAAELAVARRLANTAAGVIVCSTRMSDHDVQQLAQETNLVLVNRSSEGVPSVRVEAEGPIRRAVEHLYALGHREIAYAGGPESSLSGSERWHAITQVQPTLPDLQVVNLGHFEPDLGEGRSAADLLIPSGATAVIAFNDFMAVQIIAHLRTRGLRVPDDISVVGIDDMPAAAVAQPALTTVKTPLREIGRAAVNLLLDEVSPLLRPRPPVTMPVALVVRESTAVAARRAGETGQG